MLRGERKKEKRNNFDVAIGVSYGVASFFSWCNMYAILNWYYKI